MALVKQPRRHRALAGMTAAALDTCVPVQFGYMRLEHVTGRVLHLFAHEIDPALGVHAVLVALERQHQLAIRAQATKLLRIRRSCANAAPLAN
jgi:hypothetical protein